MNPMKPEQLIRIINKHFNFDIRTKSRKPIFVEARIIFTKLMYDKNLYSFSEIGRYINKDHSTISHYLIRHDELMESKNYFIYLENYNKLKLKIGTDFHSNKNKNKYRVNHIEKLNTSDFVLRHYTTRNNITLISNKQNL